MKLKNRLGAPESIHMRGFSPKNEQIWARGLGCRGGCYGFWRLFTLYFDHFCKQLNSQNRINLTIYITKVSQREKNTIFSLKYADSRQKRS